VPAPSKFTGEARAIVLMARRLGASTQTAARAARIDPETLRRWLERGSKEAEGSRFAQFYDDWQEATAHPNMRALEAVAAGIAEDPKLAMKWLERREEGFAPPAPVLPSQQTGPVHIKLTFTGAAPALPVIDGEVIDEQEAPAVRELGSGSSAG